MCNANVIDWFEQNISPAEVRGCCALDVGSRDVNGALRKLLLGKGIGSYTGVDLQPGRNVDVIGDISLPIAALRPGGYGLIVSSCTLEHVGNILPAISQIKRLCAPGGLIILAVPSEWPRHEYPGDYWRFSPYGLRELFADCQVLALEEQQQRPGRSLVYAKFCKPQDFREQPPQRLPGRVPGNGNHD